MHVAGIHPWDSWEYTWGEGVELVDAYSRRENDRAKKRAVALYNAAVFLARTVMGGQVQQFNEAFPGFEGVSSGESKEMTDDAMYAMARMLNAQFGGEEED